VRSSLRAQLSLTFTGMLSVASVVLYQLQDTSVAAAGKRPSLLGHMNSAAGVNNPGTMLAVDRGALVPGALSKH
jgi:hypothetical protein